MTKEKGCTLLSILYVLMAYASPFIWLSTATKKVGGMTKESFLILAIPFIMGIIIAIYLKAERQKISRVTLLRCSIIVKYMLIPLYIAGGLLIALFVLLALTPLVIMTFIAPVVAGALGIYGYATMLGGDAFSLAYISKAGEEGVHGKVLCTVGRILQFFFVGDVVSTAVLALKEKKYIALTIAVMAIMVIGFVGAAVCLVIKIFS